MFKNKARITENLHSDAAAVLPRFQPSETYFREQLAPLLASLCASIKVGDFESTQSVSDCFLSPFQAVLDSKRLLLGAQILASTAESLRQAGPAGDFVTEAVATSSLKAARTLLRSSDTWGEEDAGRAVLALENLWKYLGSPYREFERAQTMYMIGVIQFKGLRSTFDLAKCLKIALQMLDDVDPGKLKGTSREMELTSTIAELRTGWAETLSNLENR